MSLRDVPFLVHPLNWSRSEMVYNPGGQSYRLLFWSDTDIGFEHRCDRGERGTIICAPRLTNVGQPGGHQIAHETRQDGRSRITVTPSILCLDCGLHGFVTAGYWKGC